jgi:CBS domain-containing protein
VFIELVETLRCVRAHEESWLVAAITTMRERSIVTGSLGCPVCSAEYPIVDGLADFSGGTARAEPPESDYSNDEIAMRAGAFLGLGDASGTIVLVGDWARGAASLTTVAQVRAICVNAGSDIAESERVALVRVGDILPLGAGSCVGIATDRAIDLASAMKSLQPGGRLVAPANVVAPSGIAIIASDDSYWVGERSPELTPLGIARR